MEAVEFRVLISTFAKNQMERMWLTKQAGFIFFIGMLAIQGCRNRDQAFNGEADAIYPHYKISGRAGDDRLTLLLQFRIMDDEGDAIKIPPPGKVLLDGKELFADSAGLSGYVYEIHPQIDSFAGNHKISYTDNRNRLFEEEFEWEPVRLISTPPDTIGQEPLNFEFSGLDSVDYLRILVTDTSFVHDGINRVQTVKNNKLAITPEFLPDLSPGPVLVEFIREKSQRLKNRPPAGGRFEIYYSISHEFWLKDQEIPADGR
jgi:hypothetical protein